jgi:radical SAM protein with 4Fe4S-binding SPASM domain
MEAVLLTNGTLLDEEKIHSFVYNRLDQVRVSLWASSPEEYAENYPGTNPRWFGETLRGLRLIGSIKKSRGSVFPRTALHVVLDRFNWRQVDSFIDLALEAGVGALSLSPLRTLAGRLSELALSAEEECELKDNLRRARTRLRRYGLEHNIGETLHRYEVGNAVRQRVPCYVAWTHPRIRVDGTVYPCAPCDWPMGNLREQSLGEIWNGPAYRSFRKKVLMPVETELAECDCSYCCLVTGNERIHRVYKWLAPLSRAREI